MGGQRKTNGAIRGTELDLAEKCSGKSCKGSMEKGGQDSASHALTSFCHLPLKLIGDVREGHRKAEGFL
jgi:hypothetical protein